VDVVFFLPERMDLDQLSGLDPDRDWRRLVTGEHAWILQTFLRLRAAGHPVELRSAPPPEGVLVFHAKHRFDVVARWRELDRVALVAVRGDNRDPDMADFEVVQNGRFATPGRRFFMPHWPQPGLVPRDPARAERLENVAYKGFARNLHPELRSSEWRSFLTERDKVWRADAVDFADAATDAGAIDWPDFHEVDLVVAVRPPSRSLHSEKPPTKLINAWLAGVPILIGPEHAARELRRSPLDYIEVTDRAEAEAAVDRLRNDPGLYRAMVDNGRERGREFTVEATRDRWRRLLFETLPPLAEVRLGAVLRRLPLPLRRRCRRLWRVVTLRPGR
jgi:hypothetical protein